MSGSIGAAYIFFNSAICYRNDIRPIHTIAHVSSLLTHVIRAGLNTCVPKYGTIHTMAIGSVSDADFFAELASLGGTTRETNTSVPTSSVPEATEEATDINNESGSADDSHLSSLREHTPRNLTVLPPVTIERDKRAGRRQGDVAVPESLRKLIAETALMDGRDAALQLAKDFGISASSVSAYSKGATSTASYNEPKSSIIGMINKSKERAIKRASKTLNQSLAAISQDKLDNTDAKDLAGIARDMSVLIKNLEPSKDGDNDGGSKTPQFVIFAPQFRDERSFETIQVVE